MNHRSKPLVWQNNSVRNALHTRCYRCLQNCAPLYSSIHPFISARPRLPHRMAAPPSAALAPPRPCRLDGIGGGRQPFNRLRVELPHVRRVLLPLVKREQAVLGQRDVQVDLAEAPAGGDGLCCAEQTAADAALALGRVHRQVGDVGHVGRGRPGKVQGTHIA
eukprot:scaffold2231_cov106-Isochrysis_galbana.AAC.4